MDEIQLKAIKFPKQGMGWRASLANGWTRCTQRHLDAESAIDCLHEAIARAFKQ